MLEPRLRPDINVSPEPTHEALVHWAQIVFLRHQEQELQWTRIIILYRDSRHISWSYLKLILAYSFSGVCLSGHYSTDEVAARMSFFSIIPDILPMILPSTVQVTKASELELQRAGTEAPMIRQGAVIGKSDRMCATGRLDFLFACIWTPMACVDMHKAAFPASACPVLAVPFQQYS